MKTIKLILTICFIFILSSCNINTTPADLSPIINGQFKDNQATFYPSTDYKVAAIVIDKNGDVWYLRTNGYGTLKDNLKIFNIKDYK